MFVVLGPLLLALAALGIYAVVAYSVSRRTTEIGVKLALGATPSRIISQVMGQTMRVVVAGALAGWALAFLVSIHLVRGPIALSVFVGVPAILLSVSAFACWVSARRAALVDPLKALRTEE